VNKKIRTRALAGAAAVAAAAGLLATSSSGAFADTSAHVNVAAVSKAKAAAKPVKIEVFAPEKHDIAGIEGKGWFVDMELSFPGGPNSLKKTGFTDLQLTGPGVHANVAPAPGLFGTGKDDRNPGLVVLTSTTNSTTAGFSGPGTNLANLFNITGVTNRSAKETELWDTWEVGAAIAGKNVNTTLTVAEVADLNHNGIFDDAPNVVKDVNHDHKIDAKDLTKIGVSSNIVTVPFRINGAPA
jgi:hypothetical protein